VKTLRILHLEDNSLDHELTVAKLAEGGLECECIRVDNEQDFSRAMADGHLDLVLAEHSLPSFDGRTALRMTRERHPHLPFLFVTSALGEELAIEALKSGATDFILKQSLERLVPSIERALRESGARRERERAEESLLFLAGAGTSLGTSLDYETTLSSLTRIAVPFLADFCLVDVLDNEGVPQLMAVGHIHPEGEDQLRRYRNDFPLAQAQNNSVLAALHNGEALFIADLDEEQLRKLARNEEHLTALRSLDTLSSMALPLLARGRTLGLVTFATLREGSGRRYDAHDLALARSLASRAALAIDNARLHRETRQAVSARDEFLATLSHELRTPLNAMLGWTQLLRSGNLDEETTQQALEVIERNTKAQAQLIEDLLEVSRIITGKLRVKVQPVDMSEVIDAAIESVRLAADAKNISSNSNATTHPTWFREMRIVCSR
jgi:signal transduction histidine kinase